MKDTAYILAKARAELEAAKEIESEILAELQSHPLYKAYEQAQDDRKAAAFREGDLKGQLTAEMIEAFREDGVKSYDWGVVTESESETVDIQDDRAVIIWASEKGLTELFTLNFKALQDIALTLKPPGVTVKTETKLGARINGDLSPLLESEAGDVE